MSNTTLGIIGILKRIGENQEHYIKKESEGSETIGCIFMYNDDEKGTYSPLCENGVTVDNITVYRWLESSEYCPFCGLLSGTVK